MKTALLMRHAKSDRDGAVPDADRPLAARGREDAPRMGRLLKKAGLVPDAILASPARRAKETAELVAKAVGFRGAIAWEGTLYEASGSAWLAALRRAPKDTATVLVVAHSPGIEEAIASLAGGPAGRRGHGGALAVRCATGAIARLELAVDGWGEVEPGCGALEWLAVPRLLKAMD